MGWLLALGLLLLVLVSSGATASPPESLEAADRAPSEAVFREAMTRLGEELGDAAPPELSAAVEEAARAAWPDRAREALRVVRARMDSWQAVRTDAPVDEARLGRLQDGLRSILKRPEFLASARAQGVAGWLERTVKDFLERLFAGGAGFGPSLVGSVRLVASLLLAAFLLLLVWGAVVLLRGRRGGPSALPASLIEGLHEGLDRPAAGWLEEAEAQALRGDFRAALRFVFLGLLRRLDDLEVLRLERDRTNWELVRQLGDDPRRPDLEAATRLFESRWYALREASPEDYGELLACYDRLLVEVRP